jgi:hypothetical protein
MVTVPVDYQPEAVVLAGRAVTVLSAWIMPTWAARCDNALQVRLDPAGDGAGGSVPITWRDRAAGGAARLAA